MRGPLAPSRVPLSRTRAERFDDLVLDAVELLEQHWAAELAIVDFAVDEVPPVDADPHGAGAGTSGGVPMSRFVPGTRGSRPRVVIYRRPLETRASGSAELGALVYRVVVRELANVLGLEPEMIDPYIDD